MSRRRAPAARRSSARGRPAPARRAPRAPRRRVARRPRRARPTTARRPGPPPGSPRGRRRPRRSGRRARSGGGDPRLRPGGAGGHAGPDAALLPAAADRVLRAAGQQVTEQRRTVDQLHPRAGPLERPGVRRGAGPRPAEVRPARRAAYTVIDADPAPVHTTDPKVAAAAPQDAQNSPWYGQLWQSVVIADRPAGKGDAAPSSIAGPASSARHRDQQPARPAHARGGPPPTSPPSRRSSAGAPRGVVAVAHRCPCGDPDVVETAPRLPDGTPFPTTYYLTCPRLTGAISTLEAAGLMREMTDRLDDDPELAAALPRRARGLPAPPGRARRRARDRGHLRRRHADPGQVPARAGRATRWPPAPA